MSNNKNDIKEYSKNTIKGKEEVKLTYVNKNDLKFFKELLTIESISGEEHLMHDIITKKLRELGFTFKIDSIGNIYAIRGNAKKYIMLNAHMDIVNCSFSYTRSTPSVYDIKDLYGYSYEDYWGGDDIWCFCENVLWCIERWRDESSTIEEYYENVIKEVKEYTEDLSIDDAEDLGLKNFIVKKETSKERHWYDKATLKEMPDSEMIMFLENLETICTIRYNEMTTECDKMVEEDYLSFAQEESLEEEADREEILDKETYEVIVDLFDDKIYGKGKQRVLGGDDKCGIFIALKVAEMLPNLPLKILFTTQEERGCVGISKFIETNVGFFEDVRYSLTIDRRSGSHLLWSQCGTRSCTNEFAAAVAREGVIEGIEVKLMDGSVADVIEIRNHVPNSINMSAGYYNPHSADEYIIPSEVDKIVGWVKNILLNV